MRRFASTRSYIVGVVVAVMMVIAVSPGLAFAAASSSGYVWPLRVAGYTSGYTSNHGAIDISNVAQGSDVLAVKDGTVKYVQTGYTRNPNIDESSMASYGNCIIMYHPNGGTCTIYAHLKDVKVKAGDSVKQGQVIGTVGNTGRTLGNTGIHLHFELRTGANATIANSGKGTRVNPLNYVGQSNIYDGKAPSTPTNLKLSQTTIKPGGSSVLSWNAASNATSYVIDGWCNGKEVIWKDVGNTTSYTLSGLGEGSYSLFVIAKNGSIASGSSAGITLAVSNMTLSAPTGVKLSTTSIAEGASTVLSWNAVANAKAYIIDGWCDGREVMWKNVGNVTNFTLSGLSKGEKYSFFVIAVNGGISSASSKGVSLNVTSLPQSHATLSKSHVLPNETSILEWTKVTGAKKYIVDGWHNNEEIMWKDVTPLDSLQLSYSELGKYTFFVIATNDVGKSTSIRVDLIVRNPSSIDGEVLTLQKSAFTYNAMPQLPTIQAVGGKALEIGTDYTLRYSVGDSQDIGRYTVWVVGQGEYSGTSAKATYEIKPATISSVSLSNTSFEYNGTTRKPRVNAVGAGSLLLDKSDYEVTYSDTGSKTAGDYSVTIAGKGNYAGEKTVKYKITQASNSAKAAKTSVKKTLKVAKLKKKAATVALPKVTAKFGKATWKVAAKDKKKVLTLKSGKIQVKKGAKKGTYTIKLKASVAKTKNYKAASTKVVTVKVTVK